MTVKEKLVATLPPLGFIVDGHTEEFDFCCEDVNGYDCLLTLELHPNFLYAVAFVFPSPQSPDSVEFDIEFPLTVTRLTPELGACVRIQSLPRTSLPLAARLVPFWKAMEFASSEAFGGKRLLSNDA